MEPTSGRTLLILLRHGIAEDRSLPRPDAQRALTDRGRRRTAAVCAALRRSGLRCDRLLSSPLVRARETAELAVAQGVADAFALSDALRPGGDAGSLLEPPAAGVEGDLPRRLGLVGHEPQLSELAARLIGAPPGGIGLRKAGVILLEVPAPVPAPGPWGVSRLIGLLSPRILLR